MSGRYSSFKACQHFDGSCHSSGAASGSDSEMAKALVMECLYQLGCGGSYLNQFLLVANKL